MDKSTMDVRMRKWADLLEKQMQSGLSKQDWCEQNGISRQKFFRWQRKIRSYILQETGQMNGKCLPATQTKDDISGNAFAELVPASLKPHEETSAISPASETVSAQPARSIEIRHGNFTVSLCGTIDEAALTSVLRAVSHAGC